MMHTTPKGRSIAITSGKGGVGKTSIAANLAWALTKAGNMVLVLDADLGLANIDIMMNLHPTATLHEAFIGELPLDEVIMHTPQGFDVLPAGSGLPEYSRLTSDVRLQLHDFINELCRRYDYVLLDTGAGISDIVMYTASLAQEVVIIATPEPTSFADAYATLKVMATQHQRSHFSLIMNQVSTQQEGRALAEQLQHIADRFLGERAGQPVTINYLGEIPHDAAVPKSVRERRLLLEGHPNVPAAKALIQIATAMDHAAQPVGRV
jgi:flagellar biosynthesis protein FlhG